MHRDRPYHSHHHYSKLCSLGKRHSTSLVQRPLPLSECATFKLHATHQGSKQCSSVMNFCYIFQALFKLPTEIIAAAMNVTPAQAAGVAETAATKNIYPGAASADCQR